MVAEPETKNHIPHHGSATRSCFRGSDQRHNRGYYEVLGSPIARCLPELRRLALAGISSSGGTSQRRGSRVAGANRSGARLRARPMTLLSIDSRSGRRSGRGCTNASARARAHGPGSSSSIGAFLFHSETRCAPRRARTARSTGRSCATALRTPARLVLGPLSSVVPCQGGTHDAAFRSAQHDRLIETLRCAAAHRSLFAYRQHARRSISSKRSEESGPVYSRKY